MIKVERLTVNDYEEVLQVMNESFTEGSHIADFEKHLPIMWTREHDYMSRHFGIREEGKLVAVVGVYPLPVNIAGHELMFSTMGNIGTSHGCRGKGYMKALLAAAMEELDRIGADASRLGGLRSRYNRYGYDHAGVTYHFTLTRRNVLENPPEKKLHFRLIEQNDTEAVAFARSCQQRNGVYALRQTHLDFYMSMRAWEQQPYLALDENDKPVGYVCTSADFKAVAEAGVTEEARFLDVVSAFLLEKDVPAVKFQLSPWDQKAVAEAFNVCEGWNLQAASMFKIMNWDRVTQALFDLACTLRPMADGEAKIHIKDWGTLKLTVKDQKASVVRVDEDADITLDHRTATQVLFGPLQPAVFPEKSVLSAWLPLPLGWNGQDRV